MTGNHEQERHNLIENFENSIKQKRPFETFQVLQDKNNRKNIQKINSNTCCTLHIGYYKKLGDIKVDLLNIYSIFL